LSLVAAPALRSSFFFCQLADSPEEILRIITDNREMVGIPESVPDAFR